MTIRIRALSLSAFALLSMGASQLPVRAADLQEPLAKIQELDTSGDKLATYQALRSLLLDYYQEQPFQTVKAVFTKAAPLGFSMYELHDTNTFKSGETVHFYTEPLGMKWAETDDNQYQMNVQVGMKIATSAGAVLFDEANAATFVKKVQEPTTDFYIYLHFDTGSLPAGGYTVDYTLTDVNKGETTKVSEAIVIE